MALKDRIQRDNNKIFMNADHFSDTHTWNGTPFTCVKDDEITKHFKFNDNIIQRVIFVTTESLPARAVPDTTVILDGVQMRVMDVIDAKGMKEIHLQLLT